MDRFSSTGVGALRAALFLIAKLMLFSQCSLQAQSVRMPLHAVRNTDGDFDTQVRQHIPEIASTVDFPNLKKIGVLVINDSTVRLAAVSIQWTKRTALGAESVSYSYVMPAPLLRVPLPGYTAILEPSESAFLTPLGYYKSTGGAQTISSSPLIQAIRDRTRVGDLLTTQVSAKIDAGIFKNGFTVGKDQGGLVHRFACERDAAINEAKSLLPLFPSSASVAAKLDTDMRARSADDDLCPDSKQRASFHLKAALHNDNFTSFQTAVQKIAAAPVTELRPLSAVAAK